MKGYIYSIGLVIISLIALTTAYVSYEVAAPTFSISRPIISIYDSQEDLLDEQFTQSRTNNAVALNAIQTYIALGSHSKTPDCGLYYGIPLLSYKNKFHKYATCNPNYPQDITNLIPSDQFETYATNNLTIAFFSKELITQNLTHNIDDRTISLYPKSSHQFKFSSTPIELAQQIQIQLNEGCSELENEDLQGCAKKIIEEQKLLKQIFPQQIQRSLEKIGKPKQAFSIATLHEYFRQIQETPQTNCLALFPRIEEEITIPISNPVDFQPSTYTQPSYKFNLVVGEETAGTISGVPKQKLNYDLKNNALDGESANNLLFYKNKDIYFLNEETASKVNLEQCQFEDRFILLQADLTELYPKGQRTIYNFALYIEDKAKPQTPQLQVLDKNFDENSLLIVMPQTNSKDLAKIQIRIDDELVKEIKPYENLKILTDLSLKDGSTFYQCTIRDKESYKSCQYNTSTSEVELLRNTAYYSKGQEPYFIYVASGLDTTSYNVEVTYIDQEGNNETSRKRGKVVDDLPLAPIQNSKIEVYPGTQIIATATDHTYDLLLTSIQLSQGSRTLLNMDGTISNDIPEIELLHSRYPITTINYDLLSNSDVIPPSSGAGIANVATYNYLLQETVNYVPVLVDDALKNLNLPLEVFGYKSHAVSGSSILDQALESSSNYK